MSTNLAKIETLVDKVLERTITSRLRWKQLTQDSFESRLSDFSFLLRATNTYGSVSQKSIDLKITRLDGKTISEMTTNTMRNALIPSTSGPLINNEIKLKLEQLYQIVSDTNSDLDELISALD